MSAAAAGGPAAWKKDHLWQFLLALGFEPDRAAAEAGKLTSHTKLGVSMFDKPNSDAFHIVAYFLFTTLSPSHAKEVFRFCWPPVDRKADAEFRKQCCEWLKRISDECGSSFPQVVGSLFLSPGGPKFVDLMYSFARFVAMQYIKTNSESSNKCFVESFNIKFQDPHKSFTRCHVGRTWFLQILQKEDSLIRYYRENSQLLIKQIRELNSQYTELQKLQKKYQNEDQINISEKVQKVRLMWDSVMETLTFLEKEREVVNSVITGHVDQYTLDGTGVAIKVPRRLLDRIEKQMYHLFIGNIYEAGNLNLLTVIQLLNEALKILKDERSCTDQTGLPTDLRYYVERQARIQKNTLSQVKQMRNKIKQETIFIKQSNSEKQREWNKKWEEFLNQAPFSLIKDETPALDLLPAMSPLSFDPASEEVYESSIFFRYPISLPDTSKKHTQEHFHWKGDDTVRTTDELVNRVAVLPEQSDITSDSSSVKLLEKDVKTETLRDKEQPVSKNKKTIKMDTVQSLSARKNRENCVLSTPVVDPFNKEVDHLAEEVVKAVVTDSPELSKERDTELGDLISCLFSNPFLTRKQIPRTPENLTPEIRNSQRDFQDGVDPAIEVIQMDAVSNDQTHSSMNNFLSGSALNKSFLPEEKGSPKLGPQENIGTSHLDPLTGKCAKTLNKRIWEQNSESSVLQVGLEESHTGSSLSAVENKINGIGGKEEQVNKKLDFSSASCKEHSWVHTTLLWNSAILNEISSNSREAGHFDILHETLPEVADNLSFNSSYSTESGDEAEKSSVAHDILMEESSRKKLTTEERNLSFEAICGRFEALKKSMYEKKKASPQFSPETFIKDDSKLGCTSNNMETDDMFNSLGYFPALYTDNIKPSLRMSFGERKSLSPLIRFSPEEQRQRSTKPKNIGEFLPYLKEEENLDTRLGSSSNLKAEEDGAVAQLIEL